jgi:hypothetical protein
METVMATKNTTKNAPKFRSNPQVKMSNLKDCVDTSINKKGDAVIVTLSMFAGLSEQRKEGKAKWNEMGAIDLDGTFDVEGTMCRFCVAQVWRDSKKHHVLSIRPVKETKEEEIEEDDDIAF